MTKIIIFFIRKKLGLKKYQRFQFANQKSVIDRYYFTDTQLMKEHNESTLGYTRPSNIKLNFIVSDACKIKTLRV